MNILILADRDWLHPNTGGHGLHVEHNVRFWTEWGHDVTLITGRNPGALNVPLAHGVAVRRYGNRLTVHAVPALLKASGRLPKADVVLEYVNGITWLTPLWLRTPSVVLVHHLHREMYSIEFGRPGAVPAALAETLPLKTLYKRKHFVSVSHATKDGLAETCGIPSSNISVVHPGVETRDFSLVPKSRQPRLVFLGRLKAYKRVEMLIDLLPSLPDVHLDVVGDGDHETALRKYAVDRKVADRVLFHGYVNHERKNELLGQAWVAATCSTAEGWSSSTIEAAACGTPTVAFPVGGLRESIIDSQTGLHVTTAKELSASVSSLIRDAEFRERLSLQARDRALALSWETSARGILDVLTEAATGSGSSHL